MMLGAGVGLACISALTLLALAQLARATILELDLRATQRAQARADADLADRVAALEAKVREHQDILVGMRVRGR